MVSLPVRWFPLIRLVSHGGIGGIKLDIFAFISCRISFIWLSRQIPSSSVMPLLSLLSTAVLLLRMASFATSPNSFTLLAIVSLQLFLYLANIVKGMPATM